MFCINCFHKNTTVTNSRPKKKHPVVWRRRTCEKCGFTFTTNESPILVDSKKITLSSGASEPFNPGKLIISIANAFSHDPALGSSSAFWLAQSIELTLSTEYPSITSEDIEAVTHATLRRFDELAAVQYAAKHKLVVTTKQRRGRPSLVWREQPTRELPSR